jgi:hypothetical protein
MLELNVKNEINHLAALVQSENEQVLSHRISQHSQNRDYQGSEYVFKLTTNKKKRSGRSFHLFPQPQRQRSTEFRHQAISRFILNGEAFDYNLPKIRI